MSQLRVLCGPDPSHLKPITHLVNTNVPCRIASDMFEGQIIAHIKGFNRETEYFEREDRKGITWSIQVQGRFLQPHSADDILFGNTFDRPLHLPWGSGAALKFMSYIDPTLSHDLTSPTKPWALSPLIATMPHFAHTHTSANSHNTRPPSFPSFHSLSDDNSQLYLAYREYDSEDDDNSHNGSSPGSASSSSSSLSSPSSGSHSSHNSHKSHSSHGSRSSRGSISAKLKSLSSKVSVKSRSSSRPGGGTTPPPPVNLHTAAQRRTYFSSSENRRDVVFGPEDILTTDFCYGFLEFSPGLTLRLPGGISFDLLRYWDGQPVRFMCCERKKENSVDDGLEPWGRSFWCVAIELVD